MHCLRHENPPCASGWPKHILFIYTVFFCSPLQDTRMLTPPLTITTAAELAGLPAMRNVWRASELAISRSTTCTTGHSALDAELPNGGWPRSALVELLVQQHGIGEMQLLKPCLASLSRQQRVALIQPPYLPHAMTCRSWQLNDHNVLWLHP